MNIVCDKKMINNTILTIIWSIMIILILCISAFLILINYDFFVNVNDLYIANTQEDNNSLVFYLCSEQYDLDFSQYEVAEDTSNKIIYLKVAGKYRFDNGHTRFYRAFDVDQSTKKICIEDKEGNVKVIWNRDEGILLAKGY